ncbi:MAG: hypothetical protein ACKERG_04620 [Candidatus Hodgkinia cicadicola]
MDCFGNRRPSSGINIETEWLIGFERCLLVQYAVYSGFEFEVLRRCVNRLTSCLLLLEDFR